MLRGEQIYKANRGVFGLHALMCFAAFIVAIFGIARTIYSKSTSFISVPTARNG